MKILTRQTSLKLCRLLVISIVFSSSLSAWAVTDMAFMQSNVSDKAMPCHMAEAKSDKSIQQKSCCTDKNSKCHGICSFITTGYVSLYHHDLNISYPSGHSYFTTILYSPTGIPQKSFYRPPILTI